MCKSTAVVGCGSIPCQASVSLMMILNEQLIQVLEKFMHPFVRNLFFSKFSLVNLHIQSCILAVFESGIFVVLFEYV